MSLRPSELKTLLLAAIPAKHNILVTGAPGVGKSDIMHAVSQECGAGMILSHPAVEDPTDTKGLPFVVDGKATFLPFGELWQAINAEKLTVWFLDDLGQAPPSVQAAKMQLLLARAIGNHKLPDTVTFVAATNRRVDRAAVSGILEPVKSRFLSIVELEPNLDDWCDWANMHDVHPLVVAFLRFQPDLLSKFSPSADLTNSPMPRTWHHVSQILALQLPQNIQHQAICGAVGEGAGTEVSAFFKIWMELPNIDQMLENPEKAKIPTEPAVLYALAGALAHKTTALNFGAVAIVVQKMMKAQQGEFGVLTVRDAAKRHPEIANTTAFAKLATGELGQLISGR